jgi:apolipoprotein N-acyltransferase
MNRQFDKPISKSLPSFQPGASSPKNAPKASAWLPIGLIAIAAGFHWLALPPVRQPWAAYVSAFFYAAAVYCPVEITGRGWWCIYCIGSILWLGLLQGIRLAYWPLYGGWVALSLYVAAYTPAFVAISRSLRRGFKFPLPFACAISWTGLELFRSYFATGFACCLLGHSQTPWPAVLDLAAHFGAYGISFCIMLLGASICYLVALVCELRCEKVMQKSRAEQFGVAIAGLLSLLWIFSSFSNYRTFERQSTSPETSEGLGKFMIVQHNMPTMFDLPREELQIPWLEQARLTERSLRSESAGDVEVVIWPESTWDGDKYFSWLDWDGSKGQPTLFGQSEESLSKAQQWIQNWTRDQLARFHVARQDQPAFLVSGAVWKVRNGNLERFNAALWLDADREGADYYAKRHLVMFGEYIPLVSSFPQLLAMVGLGALDAGQEFVAWQTSSGTIVAPSVCFENVVPQLIHRQVKELSRRGTPPDVLVNVTNDAWFRGSSIVDHHLNNAILCAVENRRPMLVAANSGISAWIDGSGRVLRSLNKFEESALVATPSRDSRWGLWQSIGDWPAKITCLVSLLPGLRWTIRRTRKKIWS